MAHRDNHIQRWRTALKEYTGGVSRGELQRLFDRDAAEAYRVLTRDHPDTGPGDDVDRFFHRARLLFLGISSKLSPVRRILFAASLLIFTFGLVQPGIDVSGQWRNWTFQIETAPAWMVVGFVGLLFLFMLELVDRVRVRDEIEIARQLQADLLPHTAPTVPGLRFAHSWRTANEVGGDSYDFRLMADGRLACMVGDASGHGIAAGLVMATAHATLHTAQDIDPSCEHVHARLNRAILRTGDRRTFMSLFYGLLDPATGELDFVLAGHPYPYLRRADGRVEELGTGSFPLGLRPDLPLPCHKVTLDPGDTLLLYSDGLVEALSTAGDAFGFERLQALLRDSGSPQSLHDRILTAFDQHTTGEALNDDLTLLLIAREPRLPPVPPLPGGPPDLPA